MSDCYCDYDRPAFYVASIRMARKVHRCDECGGEIRPGEQYEHVSAKWDGSIGTVSTCRHCHDLRVWTKNNVPCLCVMHGNQDEENDLAIENAIYRAPDETKGLKFGYLRRKVARRKFYAMRMAA
jgi:hypothetical protein